MPKRVLTLIDEANIAISARDAGVDNVDWRSLAAFLVVREPGREALDTYFYIGLPPDIAEFAEARESKERFVHDLRSGGFQVVTAEGSPTEPGHYKADVDVLMALDAIDLAHTAHPDVVVLATGDADFSHLAKRLRRIGIRVEVAASSDSVGRHLREAANIVVDLTPLFRAVAEGAKRPQRQMVGFAVGNNGGRSAEPPQEE